jgi:hypothetical protein
MKKSLLVVGLVTASLMGCMAAESHKAEKDEDNEGKEVKVSFDQVPPAVGATLTRESQGAAIKTVDMEQDEGKTIYEADAMLDGSNYEIKVDAAGKLLSKKLDNEEGEHEDKDGSAGEKKDEKEDKD